MRCGVALAAVLAAAAGRVSEERLGLIERVNSNPAALWKAGLNPRFAHAPVGAAQGLCGVQAGSMQSIERQVREGTMKVVRGSGKDLPSDFDSSEHWPACAKVIGDIRDQSDCGCCWAFSAASAASDRMCIASNASVQVPLSAQALCFCAPPPPIGGKGGCDGGLPSDAWHYIQNSGLVTGGQQKYNGSGSDPDPFAGEGFCSAYSLPHCHHHGPQGSDPFPAEGAPGCAKQKSQSCPRECDADAKAPHNVFSRDRYSYEGKSVLFFGADAIAEAIMENGPVSAAFTVYSDFENYVSGIYHHTEGKVLGGHAVRIVGFGTDPASGTKYWKVANSWNPYWGEQGYFRILRGAKGGNDGDGECGIENLVMASESTAKWKFPAH